jgi:hypothetical protein
MNGIPTVLVKVNQLFIIVSVIAALVINHIVLLVPLVIGIFTIATKKNPVILLAKKFLRKNEDAYRLEDIQQQLFNQWIATILISVQLISYYLSLYLVSYVLGFVVVAACSLALFGFCIGCVVRYRYIQWKYKNS